MSNTIHVASSKPIDGSRETCHGMAELPSPALLLDGRARGWRGPGGGEAAAVAAHGERAGEGARTAARRAAVHARRPPAGTDRCRPDGLPLRRRDLLARPRVARHRS